MYVGKKWSAWSEMHMVVFFVFILAFVLPPEVAEQFHKTVETSS